jgi:hypothetical protein
MRHSEGYGLAKPAVLALVAAVLLAPVACGVPVEIAPPPAGGGQIGQPLEDAVDAGAEPLETLAPLPEVVGEEASITEAGESIDVNDVRWTILQAVELGDYLESESDVVDDLRATGRLLAVRFQLENLGEDPLTFVGMEVADAQGGQYTYLSEALPFIIDEEACQMEELEPGVAITCTAIYDVNVDATGLQVVLTDLNLLGGEELFVDLDLD